MYIEILKENIAYVFTAKARLANETIAHLKRLNMREATDAQQKAAVLYQLQRAWVNSPARVLVIGSREGKAVWRACARVSALPLPLFWRFSLLALNLHPNSPISFAPVTGARAVGRLWATPLLVWGTVFLDALNALEETFSSEELAAHSFAGFKGMFLSPDACTTIFTIFHMHVLRDARWQRRSGIESHRADELPIGHHLAGTIPG